MDEDERAAMALSMGGVNREEQMRRARERDIMF
jgi:hypothetical protein